MESAGLSQSAAFSLYLPRRAGGKATYLLYLDESGNPEDPEDRHFVIGGLAVFERVTFWLNKAVDDVQAKHFPGRPPIEFHASHIRAGKGFWRGVEEPVRDAVLQDLACGISAANDPGVRLFACIVEKTSALYGDDAVKSATEQVCKRFDTFLARRANESNDKQRGLLVFAESAYKPRAKTWVRGFRELGTKWGILRNLSDTPYFAPANENRLLQLADFIAHAMFLLYERRNAALARDLVRRFDERDGILHGLVHMSEARGSGCLCPACVSRRAPGQFGPWL